MSKLCFLFCIFTFLFRADMVSSRTSVGTVLFSPSDLHRQCWSPEEISILTMRLILEDLLPDVKILNIDSNEFVEDIIDYFRFLIDEVRRTITGRKKHVTLLALTDLLGGYMQHAVMPVARAAYYSGVIDYVAIEKLIELFEELKFFLRTSGQGWSTPLVVTREFDVQTIDIERDVPHTNKTCCGSIIYYTHSPIKKRSIESDHEKDTKDKDKDKNEGLFFPVPFLDSKFRPSAIAVPFKRYALRGIDTKKAAYMVLKYYIAVTRCQADLHASEATISRFQNNLYSWINKEVLPKLGDDKFYSAFGGILRIEETLRVQGASINKDVPCEFMKEEGEEEVGAVPGGETSTKSSMVLMGMLILIFVWFIIGTLFICYRIRASNLKAKDKCSGAPGGPSSCSCSSSSAGSKFSISTKKTTDTSCRCCATTVTDKSTVLSTSHSSEGEDIPQKKRSVQHRGSAFYPATTKKQKSFSSPSFIDNPAIIETKTSMKVLPSIPEISEHSSTKNAARTSKRISFERPLGVSSIEDASAIQTCSISRKYGPKALPFNDPQFIDCPRYSEKATSVSSSRSRSLVVDKNLGTQASGESFINGSKESTTEGSGVTGVTANSPHIYACHSSLTGNYSKEQKFASQKPYIFGYDFQTTSSSDVSDEDSDVRTSVSATSK